MHLIKGLLPIALTCFIAATFWGCSLNREGLRPETVRPGTGGHATPRG